MAKKGRSKGTNSSSRWGDGVYWEINDYLPDWELPPGETLSQSLAIPFSADLAGRPQLFLPIYVNNDGQVDGDGSNIIVLSLDPAEDAVGFTQETYLLKESWDAIAADAPTFGRYDFGRYDPLLSQLLEYKQKTFLVNGSSRPFDTPRLIPGGRFREIIILIEDAQAPPPIQLGAGNDVVPNSGITNDGKNVLYGGAGNDTLNGGADKDLLRGEAGNDSLFGGIGNDSLLGEAENDVLNGGDYLDYLNGGTGNDTLYAEAGQVRIDGMMGVEVQTGDYADPSLDGVSEDKDFFGYDSLNSDALNGGFGNDVLFGGGGSDQIFGDDGNDYLSGGEGIDSVFGGAGADRFDFYRYRPGFKDRDAIRDFELSEDKIGIYVGTGEASSFGTVGLPLNTAVLPSQFVIGSNATAINHRFILALGDFDVSAILFFDPDGTGSAEQIELARLGSINSSNINSFNHTHIVTFDDTRRRPAPSASLPPPPSVEFAQSTLLINENASVATLTLNRTGMLAGLSQVSVAIAGGTATTDTDYNAASFPRTITFGIGESSKTIEIPILTDAFVEGDETISLSLSPLNNPFAGTLDTLTGNINSTTITIQDAGATNGNDLLIGTPRRDAIAGLNGNDTILGLGANDTLTGGRGNDTLFGGTGNDTLRGNQGRDVLALERGPGSIRILDFQDGGDRLGLTPGLRFPRLKIVQQGSGSSLATRISLGNDLLAILPGIAKAQVTKADFVSIRPPTI